MNPCFAIMFFLPRINHNLLKNTSGFTLLELMIVVIIAGLLAAIAIPTLVAQVDKAKYAGAKAQMGCMMRELKAYRFENSHYPPDANRNTPYPEAECYVVHEGYKKDQPEINQKNDTDIPFNSVYDYENWGGDSTCYIAITFFGKNGLRAFEKGDKDKVQTLGFNNYSEGDDNDDLVLLIENNNESCSP
ncbi:MAG: type IV pilin protein [Microcystaceae cyanobacterium]